MFTDPSVFCRTFATRMERTERQKRARALASQYLELLIGHEADQEKLVRRMVDERFAELQPMIEDLVEKRVAFLLERNKKH